MSEKVYRLSKSQYCKGKKCQKALWLYRHKRDLADEPTPFQQNIFDQGTAVGKLATQCFEGGIEIVEDYTQSEQALETTQKLLKENPPALFEPAFMYGNILIRVDVLRNNNDGTWDLIEVKSTNSTQPKSHYDDIAVQKWVLEGSGLKIKNSYLMHLNREYIRKGELDINQLFVMDRLDDEIASHIEQVPHMLKVLQANLNLTAEPEELIGAKCKSPYLCEFKSHCWSGAKPGTIHTLGRISDSKRHELMDQSVTMISEIPDDYKLSGNQQVEVAAYKNNDVQVDLNSIQVHLSELKYPLYYLDYESVAYAVPRYDGSWSHKHLISQYSLHIQETPTSELIHKEYLHDENNDPAVSVAQKLSEDIKDDGGSVIVYHKTYERDRTKELVELLPEYAPHLSSIIDRMWDLETPFAKRWYWDKEFNGSSSIKAVLPVFAPEFSYSDLVIGKGDVAQLEYSRMIEMVQGSQERAEIREALLRYCERDTLAMVIILKHLVDILGYEDLQIAA